MHIGVDLQGGAGGQPVLAARAGLVFSNVGAGQNQGIWLRYTMDGTIWYWHANHLESIDPAAQITNGTESTYKTVVAGQRIGILTKGVWPAPWRHTHIWLSENGWAEN